MRIRNVATLAKKLRKWINPAHEAARLVTLAQHGTLPIEELSAAKISRGRLSPLMKVVTAVLLDLKQQQADRGALEQEIRDRIANRTDALERKIGSLQVQATRDPLTGLGNRRGLDIELPRIVDRYRGDGQDACLLMIDLDNFKSLNDTLGHAAGDQLLKEIGQLIRSTLPGLSLRWR
jgi:PleD family two-component response regulator